MDYYSMPEEVSDSLHASCSQNLVNYKKYIGPSPYTLLSPIKLAPNTELI